MQIRVACPGDAEAIRAIYNAEVSGSIVTFDLVERSPEDQRAWMAEHSGVYALLVAEIEGEVIGFASLSPYRTRPGYSTTAEDSIYVAPLSHRGAGVGKELLGARRPGTAPRIPLAHRPRRRRSPGVGRVAPGMRVRGDRDRTRGGEEIRALARRLPHAGAALTRARGAVTFAIRSRRARFAASARAGASDRGTRRRSGREGERRRQ